MSKSSIDAVKEIAEIEKLWHAADEAARLLQKHTKDADRRTKDLGDMIRTGSAKTGNIFRDFVVAVYHTTDNEIAVQLAGLQEQVSLHYGEFVLVVKVSEKPARIVCIGETELRVSEYFLYEELFLGVISGAELIVQVEHDYCAFPTGGACVVSRDVAWPALMANNLGVHILERIDFRKLGKPLEPQNPINRYRQKRRDQTVRTGEPNQKLQIFVGDTEVLRWFKDQDPEEYPRFEDMMATLDKPVKLAEFVLPIS